MAKGPGKYDEECLSVLTSTESKLVLLYVVDGKHGSGFSVNTRHPLYALKVPEFLRKIADSLEKEQSPLQKVSLTVGEQEIVAEVGLSAENGRSLILLFEGSIQLSNGTMAFGMLPVFQDEDGTWQDIVTHTPMTLLMLN